MVNATAYYVIAPTHLGAGFSIPCTERKGAHSKRFFIAQSLWWAVQGLFGAPSLSTGNANSVQPATQLISINGGSFQKRTEDANMSNKDTRIEKAVHLFSKLSFEKQQFFLIFLRTLVSFRRAYAQHDAGSAK